MYRQVSNVLQRFTPPSTLFKYGFNLAPMYRQSTGRVVDVSDDVHAATIEIPLTWRNRNFVGTMFGGSMLSATDPVYMIQLMYILGEDYVVWDKSVELRFRRPAKSTVSVRFEFTHDEVERIRLAAHQQGEIDWEKPLELRDADGAIVATGTKTLYIATKEHYKAKRAARSAA